MDGLIAERLASVRPSRLLVATDFDGTLSDIVPDPAAARLLPEAEAALSRLVPRVLRVAVISGRPRHFLRRQIRSSAVTLLGDYGQTRTGAAARVRLETFNTEALAIVASVPGARLEAKPASTSIHFRDDPAAADRLRAPLASLAARLDLDLRDGRMVLELLPPEAGKERALRRLLDRLRPDAVIFCGDDTGDRGAFELLGGLRIPHLSVGVQSPEVDPGIFSSCDLLVDGPRAAADFLHRLADWAEASAA